MESLLDPRGDAEWEALRRLGHRMVDDAMAHLRTRGEDRVWTELGAEERAAMVSEPIPRAGEGAEAAYAAFRDRVLPYGPGGTHPRFWGWVTGTGTPVGVLAELLAATVNGPSGLFNDATGAVEEAVLGWCREILGLPAGSSGVITSGGSVANLVGLQVGLRAEAMEASAESGVAALGPEPRVYASDEVHSSVERALVTLGLGRRALVKLPADRRGRLRPESLAAAVSADRAAGRTPRVVVATAGTVNTGAIDPLETVADYCREQGLWLHVDGAVGALARMAPSLRERLAGLERADSVAFDFHKWLYVPYEAGCVMVGDGALHRAAFATEASYLSLIPRGIAAARFRADDYGLQLSRGFKALKVWMSLRAAGVDRHAAAIERNVALAERLQERVRAHPRLELLVPTDLAIVCFRYVPSAAAPEDALNALNREVLMRLHEDGIAAPSHTVIRGAFALRAAITNHRTTEDDIDALVDAVVAAGSALEAAGPVAARQDSL